MVANRRPFFFIFNAMIKTILNLAALIISIAAAGQSFPNGSYNFNGDPAYAYNKYLVLHGERNFTKVGIYRVLGTYYLMGEKHPGAMYSKTETALNIKLSYNTYNQEVAFISSSNLNNPLVKEAGTLDSFRLQKDSLITEDMLFVYGGLLGSNEKAYFRQMTDPSQNLVLYKKYKSVLASTSNYIEADIREFELEVSYYYYNKEKKEFSRLKTGYNAVKKELGFIRNFDTVLDKELLRTNPEAALINLISSAD